MYNVAVDENNYFKNYAKVGKVANGIDVESIPSDTDPLKNKAHKLIANEEPVTNVVAVIEKFIYVDEEVEFTNPETGETYTDIMQNIRVVTDEEIESEKIDLGIISQRVKTDEEGNVVTQEVITYKTIYSWKFDENKYNELVAEAEAKQEELENSETAKSDTERIAELETQIEELKNTITQLKTTLNS